MSTVRDVRPPAPHLDWADLLATARAAGRHWGNRYRLGAADVDDIVSTALVKAVAAAGRIDPARGARAWMGAIVRNATIDWLRRDRPTLPLLDDPSIPDPAPPPDVAAERAELTGAVRAALDGLTPEQRRCLIAHYWEGMTLAAVAAHLGIPESTVKGRLMWGRKAFARLWMARDGMATMTDLPRRVKDIKSIAQEAAKTPAPADWSPREVADLMDAALEAPDDLWRETADAMHAEKVLKKGRVAHG